MYGLFGIQLAENVLGGITAQTVNLSPTVRNEPASGAVWPSVVHLAAQGPVANWTTQNLSDALAWIPSTGLSIASLVGPPVGLSLFAQQHVDGATRGGAGTALQYLFSKGLILPRTVSCEHQQTADLGVDVLASWDGTNSPVLKTEGVSVPTAPEDAEFTMGPISLAGLTFTKARSITVDFGIAASTEGTDSDLWDRESRISIIQPSIVIQGIDPDWMKQAGGVPLEGLSGTNANTQIYFRKRKDGSTNELDTAAVHVGLTMSGMVNVEQAFSASGAALAETNLRMTASFDGTNPPIVVTPATAIA